MQSLPHLLVFPRRSAVWKDNPIWPWVGSSVVLQIQILFNENYYVPCNRLQLQKINLFWVIDSTENN